MPIEVGPFWLTRRVGVGGGGEVWAGVHRATEVAVAVKVMTAARARDARSVEAFRNEVRAVAGLDHPGVVTVLDFGQVSAAAAATSGGRLVGGSPYLAMEFAEGGTLRRATPPASFHELRLWLLWLLDILAHAHAHGVIHRDLKPGNVLRFAEPVLPGNEASRLRLADFGLAYAAGGTGGVLRGTAGTPTYMAPEQFRGQWRDFGPPTDLYALGCLAYALASGRSPFRADEMSGLMQAHLGHAPPPLAARFPVPSGLERWLGRLLMKRPEQRFQRAADAAFALQRLGEVDAPTHREPLQPVLWDVGGEETLSSTRSLRSLAEISAFTRLGETTEEPIIEVCPREVPPLPDSLGRALNHPPSMELVGAGLGLFGLRAIPLVDRAKESELLWSGLRGVRADGELRVVLIRGPAGVGKSRLASWLTVHADAAGGALVAPVRHSPGARSGHGLRRLLIQLTKTGGLKRDALISRLRRWAAVRGLAEVDSLVEFLSGPHEAESAPEHDALVLKVLVALAKTGTDQGSPRPILLWLDDVQWGEDSLGFVEYLLTKRPAYPIYVVIAAQDEALQSRFAEKRKLWWMEDQPRVHTIRLAPLSTQGRKVLVHKLLRLEGELAAQVEQRTQGNPSFAVQLVGDWVERRVLIPGKTGFVLREGENAVVPDGIHALWASRVRRVVPDSQRAALQLAALMGTDVDEAEWRGACQVAGVQVEGELVARLVHNGLAERRVGGWSFCHGMLRESLERSAQEHGEFVRLHQAIATTLQIRWGGQEESGFAERIGRHLVSAGRQQEALAPLLRAVEERRKAGDLSGALAALDRRVDVLDRLQFDALHLARARGEIARAEIYLAQGRLSQAEKLAAQGSKLDMMRANSLRIVAASLVERGRYAAAEKVLQEAVDAALVYGDDVELARCSLLQAQTSMSSGHPHLAAEHCRGALARFRSLDHAVGQGRAQRQLAEALVRMGNVDRALRTCREGLEQAVVCSDRYGVARAHLSLGNIYRWGDRLLEGRWAYAVAEEGLRSVGSPGVRRVQFRQIVSQLVARDAVDDAVLLGVLNDSRRAGRSSDVKLALGALLWESARAQSWERAVLHLGVAERVYGGGVFVDPDLTLCLQRAAKLARRAGRSVDASRIAGLPR